MILSYSGRGVPFITLGYSPNTSLRKMAAEGWVQRAGIKICSLEAGWLGQVRHVAGQLV